jgi:hypothetical protein
MTEGMGPIVDRSREHLGSSDTAIIAMRRMLLGAARALQNGEAPPAAAGGAIFAVRPATGYLADGIAYDDDPGIVDEIYHAAGRRGSR